MTTAPLRHLTIHPEWEANIRPSPGTAIRYGNMETEPVEEVSYIGSYPLSIVPNRYRSALVFVHDIVSTGHVITFTSAVPTPSVFPTIPTQENGASPTLASASHRLTHRISTPQPTAAQRFRLTIIPPIPECSSTRDTLQHHNSDNPPPQPYRTRHGGPDVHCRNHHLTQHVRHSRGHQEGILSTTLPRLCPSET
jgi:hypothetical protein